MDKFRCCGKNQQNLVCIGCSRIFHQSCFDRDWKGGIKLGKHNIYCSEECQCLESDTQEREKQLQEEIRKLTEEIHEKDKYIGRLRRNSKVFEDDIMNYEREHSDEIKKYKEVISTLKADIMQVAERNAHLQDLLQKTKEDLEELTALNNNLRVSCEVLEKENDMAAKEIKQLRGEVFHLMSCRVTQAEQTNAGSHNVKGKGDVVAPPRNNIFILGDGLAKGFRAIVERCMGQKFHVSALIKENALLDDVVKEVFNYTRHFDKKDYVILMAGVTDLVKGRHIEEKTIQAIKSVGEYTNVIICSVPLWNNNTLVNNFINEHNKMMSRLSAAAAD